MRLHNLKLQAIGPYAGRQEIDFDTLTAQGLFLLTGPTGAGKTTILDAVVFALYGSVPGARAAGGKKRVRERLVSTLRTPDTKPEVELEFSVSGRRFKVIRSPDHWRPAKTGGGRLTEEKASASLLEFKDGAWQAQAGSFDEIGVEIGTHLGMSADQFAQVVLLPQGEFAGFLRAKIDERRVVLERLFGVGEYQALQRWFEHESEQAKQLLDERQAALDAVVHRVSGALGEDEPAPPAPGADAGAVDAWLAGRIEATDAAATAAAAEEVTAGAAETEAEAAYAALRKIAEARTELARREAELETPARRLPGATAWIREHAGDELANAPDRWEAAATEAGERASALVEHAADEERLPTDRDRSRELAAAAEQAERTAAQADADARQHTEQATSLQSAIERGLQAEADARATEDLSRRLKAHLDDLDGLRSRHDAAVKAERTAQEAHAAARSAHLDARQARLDAVASELAGGLEPDAPCPVCGSAHHPSPAPPAPGGDLGDLEERAEAAADSARERAGKAAEHLASTAAQLTQVTDTATKLCAEAGGAPAGDDVRSAVSAALHQAGESAARHRDVAAGAADARERQRKLVAAAEQARATGQRARTAAAAAKTEAAQLAQSVADREAAHAQRRGTHASVAEAAEQARTHASNLREAAKVHQAFTVARTERDNAAALLAERTAVAPARPGEPEDFGERLTTHGTALEEARTAHRRAAATAARCRERAAAAAHAEGELAAVRAGTGAAAERAELVRRLDRTLRGMGDNARKISLTNYVLAARLEEVARAATHHLQRMSDGRYELRHDDGEGGSGQRGLGLRVLDGWTGEERDTATLSGGESFYASLSLALGLAEVVTQEAGGRPLDTLLVDEGFGSLDPDTLEDVLGVLDGLRAAGRAIGLVSHVPALAERITAQLQVRPAQRGGSTARVVT